MLVIVLLVVSTLGLLGFIISWPAASEPFTEFYILDEKDAIVDYPTEFELGDMERVTVGIVNHENQSVPYRVEMRLADTVIGELGPAMLEHEQEWQQEMIITPAEVGEKQKLDFLLFKDDEAEPYRLLCLWFDVVEQN